ncbi:MAG TPA: hypothetical protein VFQ82_04695, partial [Stellaceae bacterium]|nr:hypothetical protein [Stellaceae bacterium]
MLRGIDGWFLARSAAGRFQRVVGLLHMVAFARGEPCHSKATVGCLAGEIEKRLVGLRVSGPGFRQPAPLGQDRFHEFAHSCIAFAEI